MNPSNINATNVQDLYGLAYSQYDSLLPTREQYEGTWEDCARLTLPYLCESIMEKNPKKIPTPRNSIGTIAVNTLATKINQSLFPESGNWFRLLGYENDLEELTQEQIKEVEKQFAKLERDVVTLFDIQGIRINSVEANKYLLVMGNALTYKVPGQSVKVFSPYQYVVAEDYVGNVLKIVIKEKISVTSLPQEIQDLYKEDKEKEEDSEGVYIYTIVCKVDTNKYISYQETKDVVVPNSFERHSEELLPYRALKFITVPNQPYGRGLVEQHYSDLLDLEILQTSLVEGAQAAARFVVGLKQGSTTDMDELETAPNGSVIYGDFSEDLTFFKTDKAMDFRTVRESIQDLEQRLAKAFLMVGGNIRQSERTTATEVRSVMAELEATLGSTYSILTKDFQLPIVKMLINEINPKFTNAVQPSIITGSSALSREKDLTNITTLVQTVKMFADIIATSPEAAIKINFDGSIQGVANALGMDYRMILNSPEVQDQIRQSMQQAQQAQQGPQTPQG